MKQEVIITIKNGYKHTVFINSSDKVLLELDKKDITSTNIERLLTEYSNTTFDTDTILVDEIPDYMRQIVLDNGLWCSQDMNKDCDELLCSLEKDINRLVVGGIVDVKRVEVIKIMSNHYKKP